MFSFEIFTSLVLSSRTPASVNSLGKTSSLSFLTRSLASSSSSCVQYWLLAGHQLARRYQSLEVRGTSRDELISTFAIQFFFLLTSLHSSLKDGHRVSWRAAWPSFNAARFSWCPRRMATVQNRWSCVPYRRAGAVLFITWSPISCWGISTRSPRLAPVEKGHRSCSA